MNADRPSGDWSFRLVREHDDASGYSLEPTFRDLVEYYLTDLATRSRPETQRQARAALERMEKGMGLRLLADVTKARIAEWRLGRLTAGASNRTANHQVSILAAALNLAARRGRIDVNPIAGLERLPTTQRFRKRCARALTDAEIARLLDGARQVDKRERYPFPRTPTLRALLATGARWNELVQATWGDLDIDAAHLLLRAETTKSSKERKVPLSAAELHSILALRGDHVRVRGDTPTSADTIFRTATGESWGKWTSNFHRFMREAMRVAKVPYKDSSGRVLHVHALRHTCATRWARGGMSLLEMQRLLGHADPKITSQIYIGLDDDVGRNIISCLPSLDAVGIFPSGTQARARDGRAKSSKPGSERIQRPDDS